MHYSEKEKNKLMSRVDYFIFISEKSKRDGLLSLEDDFESAPSFILKTCIRLIIDFIDIDSLKIILDNYMSSSNTIYDSLDKQFILNLHKGISPNMIRDFSLSLLGEEIAEEFYNKEKLKEKRINLEIIEQQEILTKIDPKFPISPELETYLRMVDHRTLQKIMRIIKEEDLYKIVCAVSGEILSRMYLAISVRSRIEFIEKYHRFLYLYKKDDIEETQKKIVNQLKFMQEMGEISFMSENETDGDQ